MKTAARLIPMVSIADYLDQCPNTPRGVKSMPTAARLIPMAMCSGLP